MVDFFKNQFKSFYRNSAAVNINVAKFFKSFSKNLKNTEQDPLS